MGREIEARRSLSREGGEAHAHCPSFSETLLEEWSLSWSSFFGYLSSSSAFYRFSSPWCCGSNVWSTLRRAGSRLSR